MLLLPSIELVQRLVIAVFVAAHDVLRVLWFHFKAHITFFFLIDFFWFYSLHVTSFISDIVSLFEWANSDFIEQILRFHAGILRINLMIPSLWSDTECRDWLVLLPSMLHFLLTVSLIDFHVTVRLVETARKMIVYVDLLRAGDSYIWIHAQISLRNLDVLYFFEALHVVHHRLGLGSRLHAERVGRHGKVSLVLGRWRGLRAKNCRCLFWLRSL